MYVCSVVGHLFSRNDQGYREKKNKNKISVLEQNSGSVTTTVSSDVEGLGPSSVGERSGGFIDPNVHTW